MAASRADRIAALPPGLRERLRGRLAGTARADVIPVVARDAPLPLAPDQERLWFLYRFHPGDAGYHCGAALRLSGPLDISALATALQVVQTRHEPLRTTFEEIDGVPHQVVHPSLDLPLRVLETDDVGQVLTEQYALPFDLRTEPPYRVSVVGVADTHVLLLTAHHILFDGASIGLLVAELAQLYGDPAAVPAPPPVQYADYAVWQCNRTVADQLGYWCARLRDVPPLALHTDRPRPMVRGTAGQARDFVLPADVTARLLALARDRGTTLFAVLAAACQLLFARLSGQDDFALGTVVSGRNRPELSRMIGFLVHTVAIRSTVDMADTFGELLDSVWRTVLDAFANSEAPFDQVLDALRLTRDPGRNPLFDAMVLLHDEASQPPRFAGLSVESVPVPRRASDFDVTLEFQLTGDVLAGAAEYDTGLFDPATIDRLIDHLRTVLRAVTEQPDRPLPTLELLPAREHALLSEWHDTVDIRPATFPDLFGAQAARTPDATALVCGDTRLTYAELDRRANRLAHHLIANGVGPERFVAVALPRSADTVVAMLAVFKAGGVYLPVDPALPASRIERLLSDAKPVTTLHDATAPPDCPDTPVAPNLLPDNAAYLIYTSGSTGRPKGVTVQHSGMANVVSALGAAFPERLRFALTASFSFDASLDGPLLMAAGHELHVIDDATRLDPDAFVDYVATHRIDFVEGTPSYLRQLLAAGLLTGQRHRPSVVVAAGEAVDGTLWRQLADDGVTCHNVYGPTECTIDVTTCRVTGSRPSIGRPLPNLRTYVLDRHLGHAPIGTPGELYLAGPQLARGYHDQSGHTAERFVADPFGPPGERMYRTGDLARWHPDGDLEYLGRADDQLKINGYRVEPGEAETALRAHPDVADAAVAGVADDDRRRLVGYVVPAGETEPVRLAEFLRRTLPDHLVPSVFVTLPALPATPNGKLDRQALPAPEVTHADRHVPPRTPVEQALADVWAQVLAVAVVGVTDNFFGLGGDSIRSLQIVSRTRQRGLALTVQDMFVHQTIAELAPVVTAVAPPPTRESTVAAPGRTVSVPIGRASLDAVLDVYRTELEDIVATALVLVESPSTSDIGSLVKSVKEQRRTTPDGLHSVAGDTFEVTCPDRVDTDRLAAAIQRIIEHCRQPDAGGRTPSDFPLAALDQDQVDRIAGDGRWVDDVYPLTPLQAGMLFHSVADPEVNLYLDQTCLRLSGVTDPGLLGEAWQRVVDDTAVLRSSMCWHDLATPVQVVHSDVELPVTYHDWRTVPDWEARSAELAVDVDLTVPPLLRIAIAMLPGDDVLLLLTSHHAVLDGWSLGHVLADVCHHYAALAAGAPMPQQNRPPFRKFIEWLSTQDTTTALAHWRTTLAGFATPTRLPFDRPPQAAHRASSSAATGMSLSISATERLRALVRTHGLTMNTVVQGMWAILLAEHAATDDVVFGTTVSGRPPELIGVESMVGMFMNTVATRATIRRTEPMTSWLAALQLTQTTSRRFDHVPLSRVRACSDVPDREPLCHSMVVFENQPLDRNAFATAGLRVSEVWSKDATNFALAVRAYLDDDRLHVHLNYDPALFDATTATRLLGDVHALLTAFVTDPTGSVSSCATALSAQHRRGPWTSSAAHGIDQ